MQGSSPKTEAFVRFNNNRMGLLNGQDPNDLNQYLWMNLAEWSVFFVTAQDVQKQQEEEMKQNIKNQTQ